MATESTEMIVCDRCDAREAIIDTSKRYCLPDGWHKFQSTSKNASLGDLRFNGPMYDLCGPCSTIVFHVMDDRLAIP